MWKKKIQQSSWAQPLHSKQKRVLEHLSSLPFVFIYTCESEQNVYKDLLVSFRKHFKQMNLSRVSQEATRHNWAPWMKMADVLTAGHHVARAHHDQGTVQAVDCCLMEGQEDYARQQYLVRGH